MDYDTDMDYAFSTDANLIVADQDPVRVYCGAGLRVANRTSLYGSIGLEMMEFQNGLKLFWKGHSRADFYKLTLE